MSFRQVVAKGMTSCFSIPLLAYLSGVILVQFPRFYSFQSRNNQQKLTVLLGTLAILIHVVELITEVVGSYQAEQLLLSGLSYNPANSVVAQAACNLCTMIIVQFHFVRITYMMVEFSKMAIFAIVSLCVLSIAGGVGASIELTILAIRYRLSVSPPELFTRKIVVFTAIWMLGGSLCYIAISVGILFIARRRRSSAKQKRIRMTLIRLMSLVVISAVLTTMGTILYIVTLTGILKIEKLSLALRIRHTSTMVLLNCLLPRIYLFAFFSSFATDRERNLVSSESCVASLFEEGTRRIPPNTQNTSGPIQDQLTERHPRRITDSPSERGVARLEPAWDLAKSQVAASTPIDEGKITSSSKCCPSLQC